MNIYTYPDIPDYTKEEGVVLIFPSPTSVSISNLFGGHYEFELKENYGLPKGYHMGTLLKFKLNEIVKDSDDLDETEYFSNASNSMVLTEKDLPVKKAVFIDSTWNQSRGIYKDCRINTLKSVVLQNRISQFWRHQHGSPRWYLATIEAIHQFLIEVHINVWGLDESYGCLETLEISTEFIPPNKIFKSTTTTSVCDKTNNLKRPYNGQYDNLLFFFMYMYDLIHTHYDHGDLKAYKRPFI